MKTFITNAWRKRPLGQSFVIYILIALAIALVVGGGATVWLCCSGPIAWLPSFWKWLGSSEDSRAYNGDILRNLGFIVAGVVALAFALWRALVAQSQAKAAHGQTKAAHDQTETAQQSLLNERYQRGAEMLGSDVLSVRLGGIYALERLCKEHPEQYHIQIIRLFCAFVKNPTKSNEELDDIGQLRPDIQAVMDAIGKRGDHGRHLEAESDFKLDLKGAKLSGADLTGADLSGADLTGADLSGADLTGADLFDADLFDADLSGANLTDATLSGANLIDATLSQDQLDQTVPDTGGPPIIHANAIDRETGQQLVWHGRPFNPPS